MLFQRKLHVTVKRVLDRTMRKYPIDASKIMAILSIGTRKTILHVFTSLLRLTSALPMISQLLKIGSIRIYILMTGVVSNETNTYVRMYIEEFILVDLDTLLHKVEVLNE